MTLYPEVQRDGGALPFGMTCNKWMCDPRYSTNARTLLGILVSYVDTAARHTEKAKPYRSALAQQLGVSLSTLDRTLVEMEVAGMLTVEARPDLTSLVNNDANIYRLHDKLVMFDKTWVDPLPAGVKAADVAKQVIEERRRAKREAGKVRTGGVPKGVNPKAVKAAREAEESKRGSSTHAAPPSSTHAAPPAAPVLPTLHSLVQDPDLQMNSPSAQSAVDARSASPTGSTRAREESDSVASSKDSSSGSNQEAPKTAGRNKEKRPKHTRQQLDLVRSVRAFYPKDFLKGWTDPDGQHEPTKPLPELWDISQAILKAIAGDDPSESRTPQQIGARIQQRWDQHGYAEKFYRHVLDNPVGAAIAMVRPLKDGDKYFCGNPRCEAGADADTREECRSCQMRETDKKADQARIRREEREATQGQPEAKSAPVPTQSAGPVVWWECKTCPRVGKDKAPEDGICLKCREERQEAEELAAYQAAIAGRYEAPERDLEPSGGPAPF